MLSLSLIISVASLIIAISSVSINWILWRKVNRPIVTVRLSSDIDSPIALNMIIENTGNLPAKDISIKAKKQDALACVNGEVIPRDAEKILFSSMIIPILANGKTTTNSFSAYGEEMNGRWKSGSYLPITIEYSSLDGRRFLESYNLRFASDNAFAFSQWESK